VSVDVEQHGPTDTVEQWTPTDAMMRALRRHPDESSALGRRRQLRHERFEPHDSPAVAQLSDRAAAAMQRLQRLSRRPTQHLGR
jgi:hypothetical protein